MMPLWLYTVGVTFFVGSELHLPWFNIVVSLFSLLIPVALGMLLGRQRYAHSSQPAPFS
jgi:hypothetical protein